MSVSVMLQHVPLLYLSFYLYLFLYALAVASTFTLISVSLSACALASPSLLYFHSFSLHFCTCSADIAYFLRWTPNFHWQTDR